MTLSATQSVSKPPPPWGDASDLSLAVDSFSDAADRLINRHAVVLVSIAVPERHRTGIHVRVTGNQHERHLLCLRITNLFLHAFVGVVALNTDAVGTQTSRERPKVIGVTLGNRESHR